MLVDSTMADLSDLTFRTAFILYLAALIMSCIYYGRMFGVLDMRRERARMDQKVAVGAGGGSELIDAPSDSFDQAEYDRRVAGARKWANMTQALIWFGIVLHVASFITRGLAAKRFPLGNLYEYILAMTAVVMVAAAIVVQRKNWHTIWPWLLAPMAIAMFLNSTVFHMHVAPVVPALQSYWLPVHVSSVSVGASIGIVSGIFALLYLLRMWQPRGEEHGFFGAIAKPLPSAKTLDQITYKTAIITLPLFGIGIVFGAIWAEVAWGRPWGWDAKETVSMITWILYAAYLHARATAGWKNSKAAWINVFALAMTIFNMTYVNTVIAGLHSYAGLN
ncbi:MULTISPECIES: c-type cytochrome biogenesis protein CcsB [Corynebacterium]|uniref:C-type cytochrome biogenesis protein CcsB n=1 Tax=Corynebacterium lipophilum TaxID=2804918 RepID=A0AAW5HUG8_9CORY|nr:MULTISPECIES: c-type cytochrome biogenesis protein CcsB [Corynebacterium]MCO6394022.1 c-type cytochrome biogenesis protein CcsB [Corynebacterium lipophilum]MCQ4610563.1 c-type cytochrome biogenesis protein CcsB [Corynebacterium sp. CCUG 61414]MCZ2116083.1 c-type cytochrome biogenesis protein CcsB [Corynebacterium lipophilum]MDK8243111.1 c-type cytochrome biogenesis protein CcsB [Corynebacterium sp. UMB10321]OFT31012.1 c-type cytochrome biogenesis protein CcsB [Corynebacterium sp. HMSC08D02]